MKPAGTIATVDVGIPIHNGSSFLTRAVESVTTQDFVISNLILINDGSTDHSQQIIDDLTVLFSKSKINLISSIHASALGISATYNEIISLSKSDYLLILDQDDYLLPHFFRNLQLHKSPLNQIRVGSWTSNSVLIKISSIFTRFFRMKIRLPKNFPILGSITTRAAVLYPVPLVKEHGFPLDDKPGVDIEHLHQLRQLSPCWFYPRSTVFYQIHNGSTSRKDSTWEVPSEMGALYRVDNRIRSIIRKFVR